MDLHDYFQNQAGRLTFEPAAASAFAKQIAGDFNPLHDPTNKRFCVPGDLLFSVLLNLYGLNKNFEVHFAGMVGTTSELNLPDELDGVTQINDARGRHVLTVSCSGERTTDAQFISELSEQCVKFSGRTFPDLLTPLMKEHGVMINPERPLMIYQSMKLSMTAFTGSDLSVSLADISLLVEGKKGMVTLTFDVCAAGKSIGIGAKSMVLSGLRGYDDDIMKAVVADYNALRS